MRPALASFSMLLVAADAASSLWSYSGPGYNIELLGCNNVATHQVPGFPDFFVSRLGITVDADGNREPTPGSFTCDYTQERLILAKMNWGNNSLEYVTTLLDANENDGNFDKTSIMDGKYTIGSAYDPTVVAYNGELWVSFECAGQSMGATSSCVGPMSEPSETATIDLSRTTVVVEGSINNGYELAATVPKVFVHGGTFYMLYDHFLTGDLGTLGQMGVEIEICDGRAFAKNAGCDTLPALDPNGVAKEVWARNSHDGTMSNVVDVFAVVSDGEFVFATAGLGGCNGGCCNAPTNDQDKEGCYRSGMARSNFPLGPFDWVLNDLNSSALPSNSMEYLKIIVNPGSNQTNLYLQALHERTQGPGYDMPSGFQAIPVPTGGENAAFFFGADPCAEEQPPPDWGERAGGCMPSCGGLGGQGFDTPCYENGLADQGTPYDAPYCCGVVVPCGDADHPEPDWGMRDGKCLSSCGGLGGTSSSEVQCAVNGKLDAGKAYDAEFCCKEVPCAV